MKSSSTRMRGKGGERREGTSGGVGALNIYFGGRSAVPSRLWYVRFVGRVVFLTSRQSRFWTFQNSWRSIKRSKRCMQLARYHPRQDDYCSVPNDYKLTFERYFFQVQLQNRKQENIVDKFLFEHILAGVPPHYMGIVAVFAHPWRQYILLSGI